MTQGQEGRVERLEQATGATEDAAVVVVDWTQYDADGNVIQVDQEARARLAAAGPGEVQVVVMDKNGDLTVTVGQVAEEARDDDQTKAS